MTHDRPRIGISACLLGEPVRYDAGHKRDQFLVDVLGPHVEWVRVCPEVESGFGTPRDAMRLVLASPELRGRGDRFTPQNLVLVVTKTGADVSGQLREYARGRVDALAAEGLSGFILKKDSPSCGMERVKVHTSTGVSERGGRGLFAEALLARMPTLPVEEEGRLSDPRLRENFIERVFTYRRLRALLDGPWSLGDLVRFHTANKLSLLAHSPAAYRQLGRLVAAGRTADRTTLGAEYASAFMRALAVPATPRRHANVLQHMVGYFKKLLDAPARAELLALIDEHRRGIVPLIVPVTLIRHHVRQHRIAYLEGQTYLEPHPRELSLRNHV